MGVGVQVKRGTMQRPNLYLDTVILRGDEEKLYYLSRALQQWPGTGILYTATRASAEMVAAFLCSQGISAIHYHAGLEDGVRQDVERKWMHNQYKVVCSTNALGMGIDKPDVRFVVHYHIPASPIHYYQEMGRAGRDGQVAYCTLLYDAADATIQEYFIRTARPEGKSYELVLSLLRVLPQGMYDLMRATGLSQKAISMILADLEEQRFIQRHPKDRTYRVIGRLTKVNFSDYDAVRMKKQQELEAMQNYVHYAGCYMGYLTEYLGDPAGYHCGVCGHCAENRFPLVPPVERIPGEVTHFLEKEFLPRIEKRGTHRQPIREAGWSLS
jgi:ATP-dependent DNA helicase RecQ